MHRVMVFVLIASFALFAGSPAMADLILGPADGASADAGPAPAEGTNAETPEAPPRVGVVPVAAVVVAALILGGAVYFFGATDHPHPGW